MQLGRLDHVNVRTANLDAMIAWYSNILGMTPGPRPNFDFPGAWLYAGDHPIVHLVGCTTPPTPGDSLKIEHFAISATGLAEMLSRVESSGSRHFLRKVPGFPIVQLNLWDPDDNHIHIDFDEAEARDLDVE